MTKLLKALLAGLTLIGALSGASLAATQADDNTNSHDAFWYKASGGVPPQ